MSVQKYKTCKRWNTPGDAHALTFCCFHRYALLSQDRTRHWMIAAIRSARARYAFDLWAYVLMPEHVHLLIYPRRSQYDISPILNALKWPVAYWALNWLRANARRWIPRLTDRQPSGKCAIRFWERGGGYDGNVRDGRTVLNMIDYIHANPVRRGLVATPEEWHWSSATWYTGRRDVPLPMDDTLAAFLQA